MGWFGRYRSEKLQLPLTLNMGEFSKFTVLLILFGNKQAKVPLKRFNFI